MPRYKPEEDPPYPPQERYAQAEPRARVQARLPEDADDLRLGIEAQAYARKEEAPSSSGDIFGAPLPERHYTRRTPESNPLEDFRRPPAKGMSVWRALWLLITLPFRFVYFMTRAMPKILRIIVSLSVVGIVFMAIVVMIYAIKAGRYDITQVMRMPERTIVLDRKGNEIGTLHGENRRSIEQLDTEVPRYFIDALVMQEDRSFWDHIGIDLRGLARAVAQVFKHGRTTQGASTLTMQLAKNTYNHQRRTFDAKLTEMALARRIEATYDKKTILTCYINRVFWGHTFLGLKQAARGYFNKQPRDLTIGEAAMLGYRVQPE